MIVIDPRDKDQDFVVDDDGATFDEEDGCGLVEVGLNVDVAAAETKEVEDLHQSVEGSYL